VFRTGLTGEGLDLVTAMAPGDRIEDFLAVPDGTVDVGVATYAGTTVVSRRRAAVGPQAPFLDAGWSPLLTCGQPSFGDYGLLP
jgi:hypothetical protein